MLLGATTPVGAQPRADCADKRTLWLLASDPAQDIVHASDSESSLRTRLGVGNVVAGAVDVGEGMTEPGTILFPGDSSRRLTILWSDTLHRSRPRRVRVAGVATRWCVPPGVSLGTSLAELERLNGRSFRLFGFAFDYAGTVHSWDGGHLDTLWKPAAAGGHLVWLRLQPIGSFDRQSFQRVSGERLFASSAPAMRRLNPHVYDLFIEPR